MKQMLKKIFSAENQGYYKQITILGIKFKFFSVKKSLQSMDSKLSSQKLAYQFYPLEHIFPKGFYKDFCTNDITKRYINLMRGLDDKSRRLLDKILYRILQYAKTGQTIFLLDPDEQREISKVMLDLTHPVVLSNGYQAINGYCLPGVIGSATAVIYKHFIDEVTDKKKILDNDIIDAGAYIGDSALVLSPYTKGNIHAFEPEISNYENLKKTIEANDLKNIIPVKLGLGGEVRYGTVSSSDNFSIGASFREDNIPSDNLSKEEVAITTIDKYVEENNIKVGLIKTDVEGFEQELLKGAINTIKRDKPVLMISIYHTFDDFWNIKPMIESWNLGYTFKVRKPATSDFCGDLVLNAEVPVEKA